MRLSDIKIYPCFADTPPSQKKMERKERYFRKTGRFYSEIVLNEENYLVDGYSSYLLAQQNGMEFVSVRYGKRQTIKAYHSEGGKLYEWELPQELTGKVVVGDTVLVHTERGVRFVTVAEVKQYRPQKDAQERTLRRVIRVKKKTQQTPMCIQISEKILV